jgi:dTDP-L-rhamnose 4-epimerase
MVLQVGAAYGIPSVALRFFNIFGPRQALSNPYTGVVAIFSARLLNGNAPLIFEDGGRAATSSRCTTWCARCCSRRSGRTAVGGAFNVGSGRR